VSTGLGGVLLEHAVAITAESGPVAVSLREVQRRAGVSPAAAYRHYRDRDALMQAVSAHASNLLADRVVAATQRRRGAEARWRAGCAAYLDFAQGEPGLYRAIFSPTEGALEGDRAFGLLRSALADLGATAPWDDVVVWASCHGLALLLLDSPLRSLPARDRAAVRDRLLDVLLAGTLEGTG
jgi:AcrR family transcriptional regulator